MAWLRHCMKKRKREISASKVAVLIFSSTDAVSEVVAGGRFGQRAGSAVGTGGAWRRQNDCCLWVKTIRSNIGFLTCEHLSVAMQGRMLWSIEPIVGSATNRQPSWRVSRGRKGAVLSSYLHVATSTCTFQSSARSFIILLSGSLLPTLWLTV